MLIFLLTKTQQQRSSATKYFKDNCDNKYKNFNKSLRKLEDERDRVDNEFYNNYMHFIMILMYYLL